MLKNPRLKYCYHAEFLDDERVLLLSEKKNTLLSGKLYNLVLAHIQQGGISTEELVARLEGQASAPEVLYALNILQKEGYLTESVPSVSSELCAYWNSIGMDVKILLQVFAEKPVSVEFIGALPIEAFLQVFETSGIKTSPKGVLKVFITDDYERKELGEINQEAMAARQPWMLIKPVGVEVWIGPIFVPDKTGCWTCLTQRLRNNRPMNIFYKTQRNTEENPPVPVSLAPMSLQVAANLSVIEIAKWLYFGTNERLEGKIVSLDTLSFTTKSHMLVKRPQCEVCGEAEHRNLQPRPIVNVVDLRPSVRGELVEPPADRPFDKLRANGDALKPTVLRPIVLRKKSSYCLSKQGGYREVPFEDTVAKYQHHVSPITGVVQTLEPYFPEHGSPVHNYVSGYNVALKSKTLLWLNHHLRGSNVGKGKTWSQAKAGALCEAIERYSCTYQGDEAYIISNLQELGDQGIHPNACMNYSEKQYQNRAQINKDCTKFYFMVPIPFDESRKMHWTPVYSLTEHRFKYLPSCFCYNQYPSEDELHLFCYPDTNGNAAGNSIEEAILHGFLELVERDSVALWWYNMLRKPAVDLSSFQEPYFIQLIEYYASLNRSLYVLDLTTDLQIPSFAALSFRVDKHKQDLIFAFGAHVEAKIGIERALIELNQLLPIVHVPEAGGAAGKYRTEDQHFLDWLNTATIENQPYLKPLENVPRKKAADYPALCPPNVYDSVLFCVETAKKHELETLVLDMTRPDVGLNVVKVIVPGLRHFWKRLAPGRLYDVPVKMGWLKTPLKEEELNPIGVFI